MAGWLQWREGEDARMLDALAAGLAELAGQRLALDAALIERDMLLSCGQAMH